VVDGEERTACTFEDHAPARRQEDEPMSEQLLFPAPAAFQGAAHADPASGLFGALPWSQIAAPFARPAAERRRQPDAAPWLAGMLDEIDYGMLLIGAGSALLYSNHAARQALSGPHALTVQTGVLRPRHPQDVAPLADALAAAARGRRSLVMLGLDETRISICLVPLTEGADAGQAPATLLMLGRREMCPPLSVRGYARELALTPTETRVLELLCEGWLPADIAERQHVALSTVRTQIGSIRSKTGASSIRELVRQVARLPPLVGALRGAACCGTR
jgi:DNA-binding CsgD family transcriptional regulator